MEIQTLTPTATLHVSGTGIYEDSLTVSHWLGVNGTMSVKGQLTSEAVRVDLTIPWPDYVFQPEYELTSLEDLAAYISTHGHLPNLPSAEEVEKEGVDLGILNAQLVEKIEALTLYIIDLKNEIDALKEKNNP